MLANGTGKAIVKTGGDTWFFLTADYAFGHALERDTAAVVEANGGKVLGKVRHPLNTNDFSSFLLQAQASKAKIIGLANAGGDTINSIKQAPSSASSRAARSSPACWCSSSDVNALGLQTAQGLILTETCYWDMNDANRAWTKRWQAERDGGKFPTMVQAGVYAGVTALPQGGRGAEERRRRQGGGRQDEGDADRRSAVRQGHDPRRRPQDPRRLSVRGEEAGGVEASGRLLQAARDDPGGRGVPSAQGRRLPAGQAADAAASPPRCGEVDREQPGAGSAERIPARSLRRHARRRRHERAHVRNLRHSLAGAVRPAADRADQRLVLRAAEPRARRHLRHAQHHQLHPRRPVHDGRLRGLSAAAVYRASATGRR